ncbi:TPA: hypothetical protein DCX16_06845 [bacterium]|nr:hypothetical protein [bacterium]
MNTEKYRIAILIFGTYREAKFIVSLLPHVLGIEDYDLYLTLRHVNLGEKTRIGKQEKDFTYEELEGILGNNVYLNILPSFDEKNILNSYVIPVGPMPVEREIAWISFFHTLFAGVQQIKTSLRKYNFVLVFKTDYLMWDAPTIPLLIDLYHSNGGKIIIDGQRTFGWRYKDRVDLPWQGSLSEVFSFMNHRQFLLLYDFQDDFPYIWTGIGETTFFRNALKKIINETQQHPRKNENFLSKYFYRIHSEIDTPYFFRQEVIPDGYKKKLLEVFGSEKYLNPHNKLKIVWSSYKFFDTLSDDGFINLKKDLEKLSPKKMNFLLSSIGEIKR